METRENKKYDIFKLIRGRYDRFVEFYGMRDEQVKEIYFWLRKTLNLKATDLYLDRDNIEFDLENEEAISEALKQKLGS